MAFAAALAGGLGAAESAAGEAAAGGGAPAVLDEYSYWRGFIAFRPVTCAEKTEGAKVPDGPPRTEAPPDGWTAIDFDDGRWERTCGPVFSGSGLNGWGTARGGGCSQEVSTVCLRGRFAVPDPSKVEALTVSLTYRGGAVVYLNGKEVKRGHLGNGPLTPDSLAEEYPWEAYVGPDGKSPLEFEGSKLDDETRRRLNLRLRRMEGIALPVGALKKGVNVLAVELHCSPVQPAAPKMAKNYKYEWSTVGLQKLALTAQPDGVVAANTARPAGIQVWNEDAFADLYHLDYGDPNEPLRPMELIGVRNGSFTGQVVVGSTAPIDGLAVEVSDLKSADGKAAIPAGALTVRYPQADGDGGQDGRAYRGVSRGGRLRFDSLLEAPPAEVPVAAVKGEKGYGGPLPTAGAVQPVRVTVRVPADAAPGKYEGTVKLRAQGLAETTVPLRLEVIDWTLPEAGAFTTHLGIVQSFETLALHYKVPLWSDEHWKLIDRSFAILGRAGVDALYLPLVMRYHWGKDSLVRWVKNDDGSFSHDFSVFEKYVDTALKHVKNPDVVCLYAYDRRYRTWERTKTDGKADREAKLAKLQAEGPPKVIVPLLDPKTGAVTEMKGPAYCDEDAVAFWKPVLEGCRERLMKRGIPERALLVGIVPDGSPGGDTVDLFHEAAPWAKWMQISHAPGSRFKGDKGGEVDVLLAAGVYGGTRTVPDPAEKRYYGWKPYNERTEMFCVFPRVGAPYILRAETSLPMYRLMQEAYLMTGLRGVARVGGEFWPVAVEGDNKVSNSTLINAYSVNIPNMNLASYDFLKPGPAGAVSTARLEELYEGSQEGEARVLIEKALEAQKGQLSIGGADAAATEKSLQDMLDHRARIFRMYHPVLEWYPGSGWQARTEELYRAAAAVAKAQGSR